VKVFREAHGLALAFVDALVAPPTRDALRPEDFRQRQLRVLFPAREADVEMLMRVCESEKSTAAPIFPKHLRRILQEFD
jgi:hypothetical protein